jgi:nicotinamide mononucleotide transporter
MLELFANLTTVICIWLAGRNNINTWWTGIVACLLFGWLFYDAKLYADVTLQAFFVITGLIGWMQWSKSGDTVRPITELKRGELSGLIAIAIGLAAVYAFVLHSFTDAYAPAADSTVLAFSGLGQLLLMNRKKETWVAWLIVNTIAVPLFWSRELYLTSILYGAFWVHAAWTLPQWWKAAEENSKDLEPEIDYLYRNRGE